MGMIDMLRGFLGGETIQNALESTGLGEHVEGILGDGAGVAESLGVDLGQATESITGLGESLPGGVGETIQNVVDGGLPENPLA